jgi:hypothetical protein
MRFLMHKIPVRLRLFACAALMVFAPAAARAQSSSGDAMTSGLTSGSLIEGLQTGQQLLGSSQNPFTAKAAQSKAPPVTFQPDPSINMAAKLASTYPAAKRQEVTAVFNEMLALYGRVEQQYGLPKNDLASAMAMFILMSHIAYSGVEQPPEVIAPLAAQLRSAMASNPQIASISNRDKQEAFEQFAIISMFTEATRLAVQQQPNPTISANLKSAGGNYLQSVFQLDPATMRFSKNGLSAETTGGSANLAQGGAAPVGKAVAARPGGGGASSGAISSGAIREAEGIQTVGFYTKTGMGYGGMLTFNPTPVALFRNGDALLDVEALSAQGGLAAHRGANPDDWTKWRRNGAAIEIMKDSGWEKITYTKTMDRLPNGYTLQGSYRSTGGTGSLATGGGDAVIAWSTMSFDKQGGFSSGGGAGASSSSGSGSVVTSGQSPNEYGRYSINGYTLTLNYADGRVERRMIVTEAADPSVIWLDGTGYTRRK